MIATFLRGLIAVARTIYRYERALLGARLVLPAFVLTILAIVLFPIFLFAIGPSRIAGGARDSVRGIGRGFTTFGKRVGGRIGRFYRLIGAGISRATRGVAGAGVAITRSAIVAVLVLPGGILLLLTMLWYYPSLRYIAGPILLLPLALLSALLFWRAGRPLFGMFVVGAAALTYLGLAWYFNESFGSGLVLAVLIPALIFLAAAREIRGRGSRWASRLLAVVGFLFVGGVILMFATATLRLVSPGMAERVENHYDSLWAWSDRADTTEKAENSVEGYYNRLLAEKKRELDMLVAGKFPQAVIDAAITEYFALKARADQAIADAKAAANPPAPVAAAAANPPVQSTPPASVPPATAVAGFQPARCTIPSEVKGGQQVFLIFKSSTRPFVVSWVDQECQEKVYGPPAGARYNGVVSRALDVWVVKDARTGQVIWGPYEVQEDMTDSKEARKEKIIEL